MHHFEGMASQRTVGAVRTLVAQGISHIGYTQATAVLNPAMLDRHLLKFFGVSTLDTDWATESVRIRHLQHSLGAVNRQANRVAFGHIEASGQCANRAVGEVNQAHDGGGCIHLNLGAIQRLAGDRAFGMHDAGAARNGRRWAE